MKDTELERRVPQTRGASRPWRAGGAKKSLTLPVLGLGVLEGQVFDSGRQRNITPPMYDLGWGGTWAVGGVGLPSSESVRQTWTSVSSSEPLGVDRKGEPAARAAAHMWRERCRRRRIRQWALWATWLTAAHRGAHHSRGGAPGAGCSARACRAAREGNSSRTIGRCVGVG
ncbi:hypothetical protein Emag_007432 [Eimeria magna]